MSTMAADFSEWTDAELLQKTRLSFTPLSKNIGVEVGKIDLSARLAKPSFAKNSARIRLLPSVPASAICTGRR
jgi:hypothetical protein